MLALLENTNVMTTMPLLGKGFHDPSNVMSLVLVLAAGMIVFWVMFRARYRRGGRGRSIGGKSGKSGQEKGWFPTGLKQPPPPELGRWTVEIHETARDLSAQIDTKMVALQVLIRSA